MKAEKLTDVEINTRLSTLPNWSLVDGKLFREIAFPNFQDAFAFMTKAAMVSEKMNHHPDWYNVYNRVKIHLSTHDCGGLSDKDFRWAQTINTFL